MKETNLKVFKIFADYRPTNEHRPHYYIRATSPRDAKKRFSEIVTWLKIYGVEEVTGDELTMVENSSRYDLIFFGR